MRDTHKIPQHIGFIMDGNRRWAKKISSIVSFGHENGGDNIERVLELCLAEGIRYVSMWALSKENILERDAGEVSAIYSLIERKVPKLIEKLKKNSIKLEIVGDLWLLPPHIRMILLDAIDQTQSGTKMTFILAIGYSGQDEMIRGIKRCIAEGVDPTTLTEKEFLTYLDTGKYPPPSLIVRTGGSIRHSGFFLYQSAYSEYFFTDTLWPDFGLSDFEDALTSFASVQRNFGK